LTIDYLDSQDIIDLHELALERYGGLTGIDKGCVEAKAHLPQEGFGDYEYYPDLITKATVYLYFITIGHCFNDGNKRTGYLSASTFLNLNGYMISVSDEELYEKCIEIADNNKRPSFEQVVEWLTNRLKEYEYTTDSTLEY
jgi:death on curing protein